MPRAKHREPRLPAKMPAVFNYFLTQPNATIEGAAALVQLKPRWLRYQLRLPHILRAFLAEKQARLEVASAGNIPALVGVRDFGDNAMAKVNAARQLDIMLNDVSERTGIGRQVEGRRQPGLQIVIMPAIGSTGEPQVVCGPPAAPLIEATPQPAAVPVPADPDDRT
jgi:hypothetical protein